MRVYYVSDHSENAYVPSMRKAAEIARQLKGEEVYCEEMRIDASKEGGVARPTGRKWVWSNNRFVEV